MEGTEVRKLAEVEDRHWWYAERRALLERSLRALRAEGVAAGTALDIGAAGGGNTRVLLAHGWRAAALEYGRDGAEVCAERGVPVLRGDATALPVARGSVDLVVAYDVLEHLADDRAAATELFEVLRPGGVALVAVPVDMALWSEHDVAAGLVVEDVRSWMVLLRPAVALRRRLSRGGGSDLDDPAVWMNRTLGAVVALERHLPVGSLPGVSVLVRARRPA